MVVYTPGLQASSILTGWISTGLEHDFAWGHIMRFREHSGRCNGSQRGMEFWIKCEV